MTCKNGVNKDNSGELSPSVAKIFGMNIEENKDRHNPPTQKSSNNDRYAWSIWQTSPEPETLPLPPPTWLSDCISCS